MDKELIEKYRRELLAAYRTRPSATDIPVPEQNNPPEAVLQAEPMPMPESMPEPIPEPESQPAPPAEAPDTSPTAGKLIAIVTSVRGLYPVKGARVTVFTGAPDNKTVIATDVTDESGRTGDFILPTPAKQLSLQAGSQILPYSQYNMLVEAEGYLDTLHLNIPVFSGVTSIQQSDLMLLETAGVDKSPQIFDEEQQFNL